MGVFLHLLAGDMRLRNEVAHLKAGSLPKKATKVRKEITRTAMATLRTVPIFTMGMDVVGYSKKSNDDAWSRSDGLLGHSGGRVEPLFQVWNDF